MFSTLPAVLMAALAGFGLAYVPEAMIKSQVEAGHTALGNATMDYYLAQTGKGATAPEKT